MRAINSGVMKETNRKLVLECIRRRPISRAELSAETQLTRASITQIVDGLMEEGLVVETTAVDRKTPGRRQTQLELVADALCVAGIYCSRRGYHIGMINLDGRLLYHTSGEYGDKSVSEIMDEASEKLRAAMDYLSPKPLKMYGLGVCLPSPVDRVRADIIRQPGVWRVRNLKFAEEMRARTGWDTFIENDSNAFALDELYFGVGKDGTENFMVLRVDESVGAGFIINNRLFKGSRGFSPEIGHITLERNGPHCICGNRGCLELYLAIPHILKDTPFSCWKEVMDNLDRDPAASALFEAEKETLAFEIMNLANVMDLDKVVVTGDLSYGGHRLTESISRFMDDNFVHRLSENSVVPGRDVNIARIACMPAYRSIFA